MKEHKRAYVKADFEKSAVAEHAWLCGHYIDWDNVEVLDQENDLCRRKVKEGIEIRLTNKKLRINRDEGRDLSPEWFSIVKKIQHRRFHRSFDNVCISSLCLIIVPHHSDSNIVPGATDRSDRRTFFLNFHFLNSFFALMMTAERQLKLRHIYYCLF